MTPFSCSSGSHRGDLVTPGTRWDRGRENHNAPCCFLVPFSSTALLRSVSHSTSSHFQPGGHSISSLCRTFSPFCGTQRGSQPNSPKKNPRVALTLAAPCQLPSALLAVPTPGQAAGQPPVSTNGVKPKALHPQPCLVTPQPLPADPTPSLPRRCRHRPFGSTAPRAAGPGSRKPPPRSSGARRPPRAAAWGAAAVRAEPTQAL